MDNQNGTANSILFRELGKEYAVWIDPTTKQALVPFGWPVWKWAPREYVVKYDSDNSLCHNSGAVVQPSGQGVALIMLSLEIKSLLLVWDGYGGQKAFAEWKAAREVATGGEKTKLRG
jgi:hypothetical protein